MRYKEYNSNKVLEQAIDLFWNKGFSGCSINEIVDYTGVNRFSLYHEFDNKEGILIESLRLYKERYSKTHFDILKSEGQVEDLLAEFYLSFLHEQSRVFGCYYIHIGTELADSNAAVKEALDLYLQEVQSGINLLLIKSGLNESDARLKSDHLLGLFCTAMSLCLIHTEEQRKKYIKNGINIILN